MKTILFVLFIAYAVCWTSFAPGQGPFDDMSNEEFARDYLMPLDDIQNSVPPMFDAQEFSSACGVPTSWDWRLVKEYCVHPIRDQGKCGSCWAHATTEMLSDRYCIDTDDETVIFSPQFMVDCANSTWQAEGCGGADTQTILSWLEEFGMVTDSCYPYVSGVTTEAGMCNDQCMCGQEWRNYKVETGSVKLFFNYTNCAMAQEIQENGPIYFSMAVYDDFKAYKGGVYHPISMNLLGTHAVKCIGWGYDQEELSYYWVCANSWTTKWGEDGFFRIGFNDFIGYKAGSARNGQSELKNPFVSVKSILSQ